ncbi:cytochrome P450 [Nonomuraea sp. MG754425]|uniref:cytochrome P450 n=1 Tax=Nonomuraea sp. MG754425 TaxID=2570319 RepID=UPI001F34B83F|nr:cytochrome P450 [Nonomuraea sp. MG754425]
MSDVTLTYNPYDYAMHEDPYPTYARLREKAPIYRNDEFDFWALTRHADVYAAGRDYATYSNRYGVNLELWSEDLAKRQSFIAMDPPEHTQFRRLVSAGFTPRRVAELEPRIRRITHDYLDVVLDAGGEFDFITDLAQNIPADVISELVGVPTADRTQILAWSNESLLRDPVTGAVTAASVDATRKLVGYYRELIADRRAHLGDDMVSALIEAEIDGQRLSDQDIGAVLLLLGVAGNESTTKILGNAWYKAACHPRQRSIAFQTGRIEDWVEETLRHSSSGQMTARHVARDVEWHGVTVPAGARLLLIVAAANRDPRVFDRPDVFDLDRDHSKALAFGTGPHFCLGASLARLETRVVLDELVVAVHENYAVGTPVRVHHPNIHGLSSLPTAVKAR